MAALNVMPQTQQDECLYNYLLVVQLTEASKVVTAVELVRSKPQPTEVTVLSGT
jgi:hypothetical protein